MEEEMKERFKREDQSMLGSSNSFFNSNNQVNEDEKKKSLKQEIKKLVEFWFSENNLSKDRFLAQKLQQEEMVDVSLVASFNKLKSLTQDLSLIIEALKDSSVVEFNQDYTKLKRKELLPAQKKDTTPYTIYIENFSEEFDHEKLQNLFSPFGDISYISVPRFPDGKFKGFAFVEFVEKSSVSKAIKKLNKYHPTNNPKGLRIITKSKWLQLKHEYLTLLEEQRSEKKEELRNKEFSSVKDSTVVHINKIKEGITYKILKKLIQKIIRFTAIDYLDSSIQANIFCPSKKEAETLIAQISELKNSLGEQITLRILEEKEEEVAKEKIMRKQERFKQKKETESNVQMKITKENNNGNENLEIPKSSKKSKKKKKSNKSNQPKHIKFEGIKEEEDEEEEEESEDNGPMELENSKFKSEIEEPNEKKRKENNQENRSSSKKRKLN